MMISDLPLLKEKILRTLNLEALYETMLSKMLGETVHLSSKNAEGWHQRVRCPFHADTRPSLGVNSVSGGFVCFAGGCNVKGSFFDFFCEFKG
ncbi:MAG: CHC2 zinc finger domain-containing protein, partial [Nitrososphaeraceae archaeon]